MGLQRQFYREYQRGWYNHKDDNRGSSPLSASSGRGTQGERILNPASRCPCPFQPVRAEPGAIWLALSQD